MGKQFERRPASGRRSCARAILRTPTSEGATPMRDEDDRRPQPKSPPRLHDRRDVRGRHRPDRDGDQVASARARSNLSDAYARVERGEAWLIGAHIAPFEAGNRYNHEPKRTRKLLLHRSRDRRAARPDEGQGPDDRARSGCTSTPRAGPRSSWAWRAASSSTTAGATSPTATPGATSRASWPTRSAAGRRVAARRVPERLRRRPGHRGGRRARVRRARAGHRRRGARTSPARRCSTR